MQPIVYSMDSWQGKFTSHERNMSLQMTTFIVNTTEFLYKVFEIIKYIVHSDHGYMYVQGVPKQAKKLKSREMKNEGSKMKDEG